MERQAREPGEEIDLLGSASAATDEDRDEFGEGEDDAVAVRPGPGNRQLHRLPRQAGKLKILRGALIAIDANITHLKR